MTQTPHKIPKNTQGIPGLSHAKGVVLDKSRSFQTVYDVLPPHLHQFWGANVFDLHDKTQPHFHPIRTQIFIGGAGDAIIETDHQCLRLQAGNVIIAPKGTPHRLIPTPSAQFITIDFPGFPFPEDVVNGYPEVPSGDALWIDGKTDTLAILGTPCVLQKSPILSPLSEDLFCNIFNKNGYIVYDICAAHDKSWDMALIDIIETPKHVHRKGIEIFVVLEGYLIVEANLSKYSVQQGQLIFIPAGVVHHLKSALNTAARVMCISFPAFDPTDFYSID